MLHSLSTVLLALGTLGFVLLLVQLGSTVRHLRVPPRAPRELPPISILKPLCGVDDDLAANLQAFFALHYPHYERLLGVRDAPQAACAPAGGAGWPASGGRCGAPTSTPWAASPPPPTCSPRTTTSAAGCSGCSARPSRSRTGRSTTSTRSAACATSSPATSAGA